MGPWLLSTALNIAIMVVFLAIEVAAKTVLRGEDLRKKKRRNEALVDVLNISVDAHLIAMGILAGSVQVLVQTKVAGFPLEAALQTGVLFGALVLFGLFVSLSAMIVFRPTSPQGRRATWGLYFPDLLGLLSMMLACTYIAGIIVQFTE